ncbi:protein mono-ADP-ribosyltransferase PARP4 [Pelomyxa schiedti]|nr:protein mono-ADP-ribosyltransferase PARP4 [Pelomyxa schiedti]
MASTGGCCVLLCVGSVDTKKKARSQLRECVNKVKGFTTSFVFGPKVTHVVVDDVGWRIFSISPRKIDLIKRLRIHVVTPAFLDACTSNSRIMECSDFVYNTVKEVVLSTEPQIYLPPQEPDPVPPAPAASRDTYIRREVIVPYKSKDDPFNEAGAWLVQHHLLQKPSCLVKLELHTRSSSDNAWRVYEEVVPCLSTVPPQTNTQGKSKKTISQPTHRRLSHLLASASEAISVYSALYENYTNVEGYTRVGIPPFSSLGSDLIGNGLSPGSVLPAMISQLVQVIFNASSSKFAGLNTMTLDISLDTLNEAEAILWSLQELSLSNQQGSPKFIELNDKLSSLLPFSDQHITSNEALLEKYEFIQTLKDSLCLNEGITLPGSSVQSNSIIDMHYRSLNCRLEYTDDPAVRELTSRVQASLTSAPTLLHVEHVFHVARPSENEVFSNVGNVKLLFHGTKVERVAGILSHGLVLPKVSVTKLGIKRVDAGQLGNGIYFATDAAVSAKYCNSFGETSFLLVASVSLGKSMDTPAPRVGTTADTLPNGFHSVHSIPRHTDPNSAFEDEEFCVFDSRQIILEYIIQLTKAPKSIPSTLPMPSFPQVSISDPTTAPDDLKSIFLAPPSLSVSPTKKQSPVYPVLIGQGGVRFSVESTTVAARILDLVAEVVVIQHFSNTGVVACEAKYICPIDSHAAVCAFECYINDKHVVAHIEEKGKARKEYKEAIEQGHGAYLLEEESPDAWCMSLGNLPANAEIVVKITYVEDLALASNGITFTLPAALAGREDRLNSVTTTQTAVATVIKAHSSAPSFHLEAGITMPYDITGITSPSHLKDVQVKHTNTKATVRALMTELTADFVLLISIKNAHEPRMWLEVDDTQNWAAMISISPDFQNYIQSACQSRSEVIFVVDRSISMASNLATLRWALQILISQLGSEDMFNVVGFGSHFESLFVQSQSATSAKPVGYRYAQMLQATFGGTNLYSVLRAVFSLGQSNDFSSRTVILLTDGLFDIFPVLPIVKSARAHTKLFTVGIGEASRHSICTLARIGGGCCQFVPSNPSPKHEKLLNHMLAQRNQNTLSGINIKWHTTHTIKQVPSEIYNMFQNQSYTIYGLLSGICNQVSIQGNIGAQEFSTTVSSSELTATHGTLIHKLAARELIRDWGENSLHEQDTEHFVQKNNMVSDVIALSKKYGFITPFTSFVAVEERNRNDALVLKAPSVKEILQGHDVDEIKEIAWEHDLEPVPKKDELQKQRDSNSFSIALYGDPQTGKTAWLKRMLSGEFEHKYIVTQEPEQFKLTLSTNRGAIHFNLYDMPGVATSTATPPTAHDGSIVFFDVTSRASYKNLPIWYMKAGSTSGSPTSPVVVFVGNKVDCSERKLHARQIVFHKKKNCKYYDLSVKSSYNLESPLLSLARSLLCDPQLEFVQEVALAPPEVTLDQALIKRWEQDLADAASIPLPDEDDDFGGTVPSSAVAPQHAVPSSTFDFALRPSKEKSAPGPTGFFSQSATVPSVQASVTHSVPSLFSSPVAPSFNFASQATTSRGLFSPQGQVTSTQPSPLFGAPLPSYTPPAPSPFGSSSSLFSGSSFGSQPQPSTAAFGTASTSSLFGGSQQVPASSGGAVSAFGALASPTSVFPQASFGMASPAMSTTIPAATCCLPSIFPAASSTTSTLFSAPQIFPSAASSTAQLFPAPQLSSFPTFSLPATPAASCTSTFSLQAFPAASSTTSTLFSTPQVFSSAPTSVTALPPAQQLPSSATFAPPTTPQLRSPHPGTGTISFAAARARSKAFQNRKHSESDISNTSKSSIDPPLPPFCCRACCSPSTLSDSQLQFVLKGPKNTKRIWGVCWMDAVLALASTLSPLRDWACCTRNGEPPIGYAGSLLECITSFFRCWISEDVGSVTYNKYLNTTHKRTASKFSDLGFAEGKPQCVVKALNCLIEEASLFITEVRDIITVPSTNLGEILTQFTVASAPPKWIICINSTCRKIPRIPDDCAYVLHSFIVFEPIGKYFDMPVNHFVTVSPDQKGYWIYDDLLCLTPGEWQGGFCSWDSPDSTQTFKKLRSKVPVFILRHQDVPWPPTSTYQAPRLRSEQFSQY